MEAAKKFGAIVCWLVIAWAIGFNLMAIVYRCSLPFFK